MNTFTYYTHQISREVSQFASRLDTNQWAILSVVVVVGGYLLLKGNSIRGA